MKNAALVRLLLPLPLAAALLAVPAVPAWAEPSYTFEFKTTVDTSSVGGSTTAPLRITYMYDLDLPPGSGPFGSSEDGTYDSYAPFPRMTVEVGTECVALSGNGTSTTVFNNAGPNANEDSFDVRAEDDAVVGKQFFGLNLRFVRFFLADNEGTMFSDTSLPNSPLFADASDFQQTTIELIDPSNNRLTRLDPGDAPYFLDIFNPVPDISALRATVEETTIHAPLKKELLGYLDAATSFVSDSNITNYDKATNKLKDFIKLVKKERGKKIPTNTADEWATTAQTIIDSFPKC